MLQWDGAIEPKPWNGVYTAPETMKLAGDYAKLIYQMLGINDTNRGVVDAKLAAGPHNVHMPGMPPTPPGTPPSTAALGP